ncbi:MAG: hypothetical protein QXU40_03490 [Candidatus Pacearchaeota archaeon]
MGYISFKKDNLILLKKILILFLTSIPLISAQPYPFFDISLNYQIRRIIDSFISFSTPVFEYIIGDYSTTEFFFAKILLLFILIIVIKYVLGKTPLSAEGGRIPLLLSIIVSILAIRFISDSRLVEGILIPYGTLGVAITTILPLIIFFYFLHHAGIGSFGRRFFWAMFGIILFLLWLSRSDRIGNTANWIYTLSFIATILLLIFDRSVHSYLGLSELRKYERYANKRRIREIYKELDELDDHFQKGRISLQEYTAEKKRLQNIIKGLSQE